MKDFKDKKLPIKERKALYYETLQRLLNPIPEEEFDSDNFEPIASEEEREVAFRKRVKPPKKLPIFGLKPKEILEGQMIGMYESKQDIYLILAHRCNDLQDKVDDLEARIKYLEDKK